MKGLSKRRIVFVIIAAGSFLLSLEIFSRISTSFSYDYKDIARNAVYAHKEDAKRIFNDLEKRQYEPYPYVMHRTKPNQHFKTFNVNAFGFRGSEIKEVKEKGCFRIVMLGGSALWGTGISCDDATISAQLKKRLNNAYKTKKFEVINAGESGYVSTQELILLFDRIIRLKPDLVIVFDGYNDVYSGFINAAGFPQNFSEFKKKLEGRNSLYYLGTAVKKLLSHSLLLRRLKTIAKNAAVGRNVLLNREAKSSVYADASEVAKIYGRNLRYMRMILNNEGIESLFVIQPVLGFGSRQLTDSEKAILAYFNSVIAGYSDYIKKTYSLFLSELRRMRDEEGAKILDLTDSFDMLDYAVYFDNVHFSDKGVRIVAQRIFEEIKKTL